VAGKSKSEEEDAPYQFSVQPHRDQQWQTEKSFNNSLASDLDPVSHGAEAQKRVVIILSLYTANSTGRKPWQI
jgi:hypothetical protein